MDYRIAPGIPSEIDTAPEIISIVCKYFDIPYEKMMSKSRVLAICKARQIAMYAIRRNTKLSQRRIGKFFNLDHATVDHAKRTIEKLIETNDEYGDHALKILNIISSSKSLT